LSKKTDSRDNFELRMRVWLLGTRVFQLTADEVTCHSHQSVKRYDFRYWVVHFSVDKTRTWEGQRDWTRRTSTRGRNCLGGPLRSCSQDSSNKRTKETGSGRTMTPSSLNKGNYSKVRAWGHRRWALITRQTALSCPIKWNSWHLTTQPVFGGINSPLWAGCPYQGNHGATIAIVNLDLKCPAVLIWHCEQASII